MTSASTGARHVWHKFHVRPSCSEHHVQHGMGSSRSALPNEAKADFWQLMFALAWLCNTVLLQQRL